MHTIFEKKWPEEELEYVTTCPVCHSESCKISHDDLIDNIFNCAPGKWTLYECEDCRSSYLNPRPNKNSMYKAYTNYYTHNNSEENDKYVELNFMAKIKRMMANGYRNWRYGGNLKPSSKIGIIIIYLFPSIRLEIDQLYRHLPKHRINSNNILDVGFGNGSFLSRVHKIGWNATGIDFDEKVVKSAKKRNLDVYFGSIDVLKEREEYFDVITLNHVIEHLYDPIETLKICYRLLKPGGTIWLETPNILSYGHKVYSKNWRGLETPRHLILFNQESLKYALTKTGFEHILYKKRPSAIRNMFSQSAVLSKNKKDGFLFNINVIFFQWLAFIFPDKKELITIQAKKPMAKV